MKKWPSFVTSALAMTAATLGAIQIILPTDAAAQSRPREVRCELVIDGRTYIRGRCDFTALGRDGSFQLFDHEDQPYFVQVDVVRPGVADASWNGNRTNQRAHARLGQLTRNGACWTNRRARVCAW